MLAPRGSLPALAALCLIACDDAAPPSMAGPADAGLGDARAAAEAGRLAGLDERPRNATCLAPRGPADVPASLREAGCFERDDPRRPAPGLIPYGVNAALWSDGAVKERYLALPDGARIGVAADGDLDLPAGTVLVKTFVIAGARVETRLFVRHPDGAWAGYSYEWNAAGTDARLVGEDGRYRLIGEQDWHFPGRKHCLDCHTEAAGFSLGLELAQLDGDFVYPNGRRANQIATWARIGLLADGQPLPGPPALPDPAGAVAPLEARARAYLHANCAGCHRPDGVKEPLALDLRWPRELAQMEACDREPRKGDFGVPGARLVAPGAPERSMLSVRMHSLVGNVRMPPVASSVEDEAGSGLVDRWIRSMTACP